MSYPTSPTAICLLAFDIIGERPSLVNIESPTNVYESISARNYDLVRGSLLEAYNWNFANIGEKLSRGGTPSVGRYPDYYVFPNDYLKLTALHDPRYPLQKYDYRIENKTLLIDNGGAASVDSWFIHDITDVTKYSPLFISLLSAELALKFSAKFVKKTSDIARIQQLVLGFRQQALAANGQANPPRRYERSRIVDAGRAGSVGEGVAGPHEFNFDY